MGVDSFFHARVGPSACILSGWVRIAFAALILYDRLLLSLDFDWLFLSGMMPLEVSAKYLPSVSLLWLSPENPTLYWSIHILTILHAVFLLVGIAPRLQLCCIYVYSMSFWFHNQRIWDSEDDMFRFWNVFLLFLPLHRCTIYEWLVPERQHHLQQKDWPIWPFRLWQIEVCAIYMCAGFAKLSNAEWANGSAMLYVVHTVDFYGGIFNPDIIFNRMGPLLLMTYASLFLESVCVVTAWIWPTVTVVAMIGLHLGIEASMNMHCFEWLCVLGWLMFLVQPVVPEQTDSCTLSTADDTNSLEPVAELNISLSEESTETATSPPPEEEEESEGSLESEEESITLPPLDAKAIVVTKPRTPIRRHLGTAILLAVCSILLVETLPLDKMQPLLPSSMHGTIETLVKHKNAFVLRWTDPITYSTGLRQTGWYMYSSPPWVVWQYEAIIVLHHGTTKIWKSPDWRDLSYVQQKRFQRHMSFFDRLRESSNIELDAFTRHLAAGYGENNVASVQLIQHMETPKILPWERKFGFFDKAKQPMVRLQKHSQVIYNLNLCADFDYRCYEWASRGFCQWPITMELGNCRYSCGFCDTTIQKLKPRSRVAVKWIDGTMYYRATVREVKHYPTTQVRLEYDYYDREATRYEWLDTSSVLHRSLILLEDAEPLPTPALDKHVDPSRLHEEL